MKLLTLPTSGIKEYNEKISKFNKGTNTIVNPARLAKEYAVESTNLVQDQDGVWTTRPGLSYYGQALEANPDGACQYEKLDGTRETIAVANGKVWKSQDKGAWEEVTGATFTAGNPVYFFQSENELYISNRIDPLAVYDGTDLTTFSALETPAAPTGARTTLTTGSYANYYRVVAVNEVGFTEPSDALSIDSNKLRDNWSEGEKITLTLTPVANATGYQIYWSNVEGEELLIGEVEAGVTTFEDTGTADFPVNIYMETPDDNTTAAPLFGPMEISGGRMWATFDANNKWRVYYSGTGQDFARFSPFYNGGYVDLEIGGLNKPTSVVHYRTGKGDPIMTVLCSSPDGNGTIFQVEFVSTTLASMNIEIPAVYKIVGSIGADAPYGVVKVRDNIFFINKKGVFALRNKEQIFNVLSTDDLTSNFRNKINGSNTSMMNQAAAYYKAPRVYFSIPVGSSNDTTFMYDMERNNWNWAWNVGFKQFFEYTENSTGDNSTHFLGVPVSGTKLVEISDNNLGDFGQSFYQSYISPLLPVSKDYTDTAKVQEAIIELGNFQGSVTCEILGLSADKSITSVASRAKSATTGNSGWGDDLISDFLFSDTEDVPTTFTQQSTKIKVKVGKKLYGVQAHIYTNSTARFQLLGIEFKGQLQKGRSPSQWAN